jgi:Tannase and feruloyl esterase
MPCVAMVQWRRRMAASPPQLEERRRKRSPSTRPPWSRMSLRNRAAVFTCRARELQNAILEKREIKDDATPPAAGQLRLAWPALAGRVIPAASIAQPSGEGRIASATLVAADAAATPATPDFCKLLGSIAPIDPAAQLINFEINLPVAWNRKAVQYGGYNGTLITGLAPLRDAEPDDPPPLARGAGNGSGPSGFRICANSIGQFGLNDEMLLNYAYASYKNVRDVSVDVMCAFYRQLPLRM